jgi:hypothetical protein
LVDTTKSEVPSSTKVIEELQERLKLAAKLARDSLNRTTKLEDGIAEYLSYAERNGTMNPTGLKKLRALIRGPQ